MKKKSVPNSLNILLMTYLLVFATSILDKKLTGNGLALQISQTT